MQAGQCCTHSQSALQYKKNIQKNWMRGSMVKIKDMEVVIIRVESNLRQDNGASL
jgi:hypothetical protein